MNQLLNRQANPTSIWESVIRLPESPKGLEECMDLLLGLQQAKGPIIETLNVLREDKPILYGLLRRRLEFRPGLKMLLDIRYSYAEARRAIGYEE